MSTEEHQVKHVKQAYWEEVPLAIRSVATHILKNTSTQQRLAVQKERKIEPGQGVVYKDCVTGEELTVWSQEESVVVWSTKADDYNDECEYVTTMDDTDFGQPTEENSGGSCDYYSVEIENPVTQEQPSYTAECLDIMEALNMTVAESNIFKEVWRLAAARNLGKVKAGNTPIRGAEKISFFAKRMLTNAQREGDQ